MGKNTLFIAILVLFDGAAVTWAAWEVWKLRPRGEDQVEKSNAFGRLESKPASPEPPGHPEGEHGADDR